MPRTRRCLRRQRFYQKGISKGLMDMALLRLLPLRIENRCARMGAGITCLWRTRYAGRARFTPSVAASQSPLCFVGSYANIRPLPCSAFSAKRHACFVCSLTSALATPSLRYHLFAVGAACAAQHIANCAHIKSRRSQAVCLPFQYRFVATKCQEPPLRVGCILYTCCGRRPPLPHKACALRGPRLRITPPFAAR